MNSRILTVSSYYLLPVLFVFSLFLLFRGHEEPGGGFVGGLMASSGFALFTLANGQEAMKKLLPLDTSTLMALGLGIMVLSGVIGLVVKGAFLASAHLPWSMPSIGHPGTALLFDMGVYLVVTGSVIKILLALIDE